MLNQVSIELEKPCLSSVNWKLVQMKHDKNLLGKTNLQHEVR